MNNRLTAQDIAGLLAEYTGKDKKDTERFLREFVSIVMEGVFTDKMVKIKGLGTFKIIPVEKRESINVNTGERFLIPEHYKFSFAPDKELKELVNKPFSFFETTEINENADFLDIDQSEEYELNKETEDESVDDILPEEQFIVEKSITFTDTEIVNTSHDISSISLQEELKIEKKDTDKVSVDEKHEVVTPPITELYNPQNNKVHIFEYSNHEILHEALEHNNHSFLKRLTILFFTLALVGIIGAYFFFDFKYFIASKYENNNNSFDTEEEKEISELLFSDSLDITTGEYNNDTLSLEQTDTIHSKTTLQKEEAEVIEKKIAVTQSKINESRKIKIKTGDRLTLIALEYYGSKIFWVYLYEHNKNIIKDPNNVPVGTEIVIPAPELYGIDAHSRLSVEKAAALQTQILSNKK